MNREDLEYIIVRATLNCRKRSAQWTLLSYRLSRNESGQGLHEHARRRPIQPVKARPTRELQDPMCYKCATLAPPSTS